MKPIIDVVAGVIRRSDGRLLIALRHEHADQGGLWEFPGGKREANESRSGALRRELNEELGIEVFDPLPLLTLRYEYPTKIVHLDVWEVSHWDGSERGCEGQRIAWVLPDELNQYDFPSANKTIVLAAQLPRALIMLPGDALAEPNLIERLSAWRSVGIGCIASDLYCVDTDQRSAANLSGMSEIVRLKSSEKMRHGDRQPLTDGFPIRTVETGADAAMCRNIEELHRVERYAIDIAVLDKADWDKDGPENSPNKWTHAIELIGQMATPTYLASADVTGISGAVVTGFQGIVLPSRHWDYDPVVTADELLEVLACVSIA